MWVLWGITDAVVRSLHERLGVHQTPALCVTHEIASAPPRHTGGHLRCAALVRCHVHFDWCLLSPLPLGEG